MHGPPDGRPRADEATNPEPPADWLRSGRWLASVAGGAIAFPIAVLVHELGHFGAFAAFGFPDPVLRYSSTSWSGSGEFDRLIRAGDVEAATALVQPWQMAVSVAAGVMVTYLTIIACVFAVRRFGPGPLSLVLGVGLVTPLRWLGAIPIFVSRLRGRLQSTSNTDEGWLAALTGIPETLLLLLGLTCLVLGYWFLVTAIPRGRMDARRRPDTGGCRGCGWSPLGPVAGAADASVKITVYGGHGTSQSSAIPPLHPHRSGRRRGS